MDEKLDENELDLSKHNIPSHFKKSICSYICLLCVYQIEVNQIKNATTKELSMRFAWTPQH